MGYSELWPILENASEDEKSHWPASLVGRGKVAAMEESQSAYHVNVAACRWINASIQLRMHELQVRIRKWSSLDEHVVFLPTMLLGTSRFCMIASATLNKR